MFPAVIVHHSQFWPTVGRTLSAMAAIGSAAATWLARRNSQHIQEVHVLVNGQLHGRIEELASVAATLKDMTQERDQLAASAGVKPVTPPPILTPGRD